MQVKSLFEVGDETFKSGDKVTLGDGRAGEVVDRVERNGFSGYRVKITESDDDSQVGSVVGASPNGMKKAQSVTRPGNLFGIPIVRGDTVRIVAGGLQGEVVDIQKDIQGRRVYTILPCGGGSRLQRVASQIELLRGEGIPPPSARSSFLLRAGLPPRGFTPLLPKGRTRSVGGRQVRAFPVGSSRTPITKTALDTNISALCSAIKAELDAASLYQSMAEVATDEKVKAVLEHVAAEEFKHVGEFEGVLVAIDDTFGDNVHAGMQEWYERETGADGEAREIAAALGEELPE